MSSIKTAYGSNNQSLTLTLASLASAGARATTKIDNTSNLFLDLQFQLKVKSGGSGTSASGFVNIYAVGSADGGSSFPEGASGTDGGVTLTVPTNARLIGSMNVVANATTYTSETMSVAAAFGGVLPAFTVIIVENQTGHALDATEGNHAYFYQGVYATAA